MIEVLSNGALNAVQDAGRLAPLSLGVSRSGAMDGPALAMANLLLGNDEGAAAIEISLFPFRLRFYRAGWFACAGAWTRVSVAGRSHPSWWAAQARAGEVLTVAAPQYGSRLLLALQGGIDVEPLLGSRATDLKSGFGGLHGRGLRKGDLLPVGIVAAGATPRSIGLAPQSRIDFAHELAAGDVSVRAVPAAEYERFTALARADFTATPYRLTPDCNRQGYRLDGAALALRRPLELLSHAVVPGTVQVPPSGQPIVQMAEANTLGGYPKIATVIEADLWRLAQLRPGQRVRFTLVDHAAGVAALRAHSAEMQRLRDALALFRTGRGR